MIIEFIYWIFQRLGDLINFLLNFHVIRNYSLLHFTLAAMCISVIVGFLKFGESDATIGFVKSLYEREENAEQKKIDRGYMPRHGNPNYVSNRGNPNYVPRHNNIIYVPRHNNIIYKPEHARPKNAGPQYTARHRPKR